MSFLLESGGDEKKKTKNWKAVKERSESSEKGGTSKMCILLLAQTNPNEQSHSPSQRELIMENY